MPLLAQKRPPPIQSELILKQIRLMESLDSNTSEEATNIISNWLKEGNAIPQLFKYYLSSQSIRTIDLLCNHVHKPFDKILVDKIHECLQNPSNIILLGRLLNNAPSWLTTLTAHDQIFSRLQEFVKSGNNLEHVNSALFLMSSLLPYFSTTNEVIVKDMFRCFIEACKLYHQKTKLSIEKLQQAINENNTTNNPIVVSNIICLMQIGKLTSLKVFFNVLYGIYPNNVLIMLQKSIQTNTELFTNVIEPVLLSCRINPNIFIENRERELNAERMKERRPDDFFALCEKISIEESDFNSHSFKHELNQHFYEVDMESLDSETFACFENGYLSLGMSTRPINKFGLDTPPNEEEEIDYFDNIEIEQFLNNSLSMNSQPSSKYRQSPCIPNKHAEQLEDSRTNLKRPNKANSYRIKRSNSLPTLFEAKSVKLPLSVTKLLRQTVKNCIDADCYHSSKKQIECSREEYMKESQSYHETLKMLKLADRLPGKIYDDLNNIMKGLSVENQRDLLESRLRLVNSHLLFERNCRLLLAKRSRKLSERLKKDSRPDYEHISNDLRSQNNDLIKSLSSLQTENNKLRAKLEEREHFYLSKLQASNAEIDELSIELDALKHQFLAAKHSSLIHQKRIESLLLEEEKRFMESHVIEAQQEELQQLRYELNSSQQQNQQLRERIESIAIAQNRQTPNDQLNIIAKNLEFQISSLKTQLQKNKNLVAEWTDKYKQLEHNYSNLFEQKNELDNDRAKKVYAMQLKSANHKYESLLGLSNKQEAHLTYLYGLLKKCSAKTESSRKPHSSSSFNEVFPFDDLNCDEPENQTVDDHLHELFGDESNEKLELIDRQNELLKKTYVPSSSLDTSVQFETNHKRRCSLTTLPVSEYNLEETIEKSF